MICVISKQYRFYFWPSITLFAKFISVGCTITKVYLAQTKFFIDWALLKRNNLPNAFRLRLHYISGNSFVCSGLPINIMLKNELSLPKEVDYVSLKSSLLFEFSSLKLSIFAQSILICQDSLMFSKCLKKKVCCPPTRFCAQNIYSFLKWLNRSVIRFGSQFYSATSFNFLPDGATFYFTFYLTPKQIFA